MNKSEDLESIKIKKILCNHLDMLFEKLEHLNKEEKELKSEIIKMR